MEATELSWSTKPEENNNPNFSFDLLLPVVIYSISSSNLSWTLYVILSQNNTQFGQLLPEIIIQDQVLSLLRPGQGYVNISWWQWAMSVGGQKGTPMKLLSSSTPASPQADLLVNRVQSGKE